ncbi:MAG: hypothetical protein IPK96_14310 [Flammeovirgaceae bacterium]|nr:hypothetical protein [Flammeovirgaceae bacterium]
MTKEVDSVLICAAGTKVTEEERTSITERRKRDFENYELAKKQFGIKKELEKLNEKRDAGQIQTATWENDGETL